VIKYSLVCDKAHAFDAWFASAAAFDEQKARGIVTCPMCNSADVGKALMAPAVSRPRTENTSVAVPQAAPAIPPQLLEALRAFRRMVVEDADYVGERFAEEARKIHFEDAPERGIYGEATREEVHSLLEDGIEVLPLPSLPEEHN
jgi:hypothetical protein